MTKHNCRNAAAALVLSFAVIMLMMLCASVTVHAEDELKDPTKWKIDHIEEIKEADAAMSKGVAKIMSTPTSSKIKGIDISYWNCNGKSTINFTKAKNNTGVKFAIVRVGYRSYSSKGAIGTDSYYKTNITGASNAGMKVGAYFFSQAKTEAEAKVEAETTVSLLKDYKSKINMPVVMDYEYAGSRKDGRLYGVSKAQMTKNALAFCKVIKDAGYTPMVYANLSFLNNSIDPSQLSAYPIWVAQYNNTCNYTGAYEFWQYTSDGSVSGIDGRVDMNWWYSDDIDKYSKKDFTGKAVVKITGKTNTEIDLEWEKVKDATHYAVMRKAAGEESYKTIKEKTTSTKYTNEKLKPNTTYSYVVLAYKGTDPGKKSSAVSETTDDIYVLKTGDVVPAKTSVTLNWTARKDCTKYEIVRDGKIVGTTDGTTFTDKSLAYDTAYTYTINGYKGDVLKAASASIKTRTLFAGNIANLSAGKKEYRSIALSWDKTRGAVTYRVYRSTKKDGEYKKVAEVKTNSYTDKNLPIATEYWYKVRPYKDSQAGKTSAVVQGHTVFPFTVKDDAGTKYTFKVGSVYKNDKGKEAKTVKMTGKNSEAINVRKGTSTSTKVVKLVKKPHTFTITSYKLVSGHYWYGVTVKVDGKTYKGYVYEYLIK